jgi:glycosyltransferase involved in cell wall biosynthesis
MAVHEVRTAPCPPPIFSIFALLRFAEDIDVSVIVPAYRAAETLPGCVQSLIAQRFSGRYEIIIVASADGDAELPAVPAHSAVNYLVRVPRLGAAAARNLGADVARGRSLAFTDADVIVSDDWLDRLQSASRARLCVAGAIANGTPSSTAGTVEYLIEFFDLSPARNEPSEHGATCNLLLPRQLWDSYGPFPEGMNGCEDTWLTTRLLGDGLLRFAPEAVVHHLNRLRMREVLAHQYALGGSHARLAQKQGRLSSSPLRDVAVTVERIRYLYRTVARWTPADLGRTRVLAPLVVAGFCAWGAGLSAESWRIRRRLRGQCDPA